MKLITRDTDYAVQALIYLAQTKAKRVSVQDLVGILNVPYPFMRKIMQKLQKGNIVDSYRGKNGGFTLAEPPGDIFLFQIIQIFNGPIRLHECIINQHLCPNSKTCLLKKELTEIEEYVSKKLRAITLKKLMHQSTT